MLCVTTTYTTTALFKVHVVHGLNPTCLGPECMRNVSNFPATRACLAVKHHKNRCSNSKIFFSLKTKSTHTICIVTSKILTFPMSSPTHPIFYHEGLDVRV
uniref:Uncharacterized protein n=1 Tax=Ixodes ricinus TaxID=34613 RepID=A0A6B0UH17_IXORI